MAKCVITGVEISNHEGYVLDVTEARRAICDPSNRIKAIEKVVVNLGERDSRIHRQLRPASSLVVSAG